jgi:hypothetical protein
MTHNNDDPIARVFLTNPKVVIILFFFSKSNKKMWRKTLGWQMAVVMNYL